jgi:hypothetical protein
MTDKAPKILQKISNRQALKRLANPKARSRILDDVAPIGGDKGEKFLRELNEMADLERNAGRKESPER